MALSTYTLGVQPTAKLSNDVVVSQVTVNAATTGVDQSVDGVIELFNIPKGAYVHNVVVYIATVEDSAATLTIGDGDNADGYMSIDSTSAGLYSSISEASTTGALFLYSEDGGKVYAAADTIDMTTSADLDTLVAHCIVHYTVMEALD